MVISRHKEAEGEGDDGLDIDWMNAIGKMFTGFNPEFITLEWINM